MMEKQQPNHAQNLNRRDAEVPGDGYIRLSEYTNVLARRTNELQIHSKCMREIANKYPGMHANMVNSLAIVDTYFMLHGRNSQNIDIIIDWSGARSPWKRKVGRGITELIVEGYLIIGGKGKSVSISEDGVKILEDYNIIFDQVKRSYIDKAKRKQATESRRK